MLNRVQGQCIGNISRVVEGVSSKEECHEICRTDRECRWFTHFLTKSTCDVMISCFSVDEGCLDCISAEASCEQQPEGDLFKETSKHDPLIRNLCFYYVNLNISFCSAVFDTFSFVLAEL